MTERVIKGDRPTIPQDIAIPKDYLDLMKQCWQENPQKRPSFSVILAKLKAMIPGTNIRDKPEKIFPHDSDSSDDDDAEKLQSKANQPSFSSHFPGFRFGKSWSKSLYGVQSLTQVPGDQIPKGNPPSLPQFDVSLSADGALTFRLADWKVSSVPIGFTPTGSPNLVKSDSVMLLRGEDGEIGFSCDNSTARHFFVFGKAPTSTKLSLKLTLSTTARADHKREQFLSLSQGKDQIVYYAPLVLRPNNKTISLPIDWDASSSTISVRLPDLDFPTVVAFGVGSKLPDINAKLGFSFPAIRFLPSGDIYSSGDDRPPPKPTR